MPSRVNELEELCLDLQRRGYQFLPLASALRGTADLPAKFVFLRHDIDTDVRTARKLFEIEKKHGIRGSWYFRLSTMDIELMRDIHESGAEVGYHYEEIGTLAKTLGINNKKAIQPYLYIAAEAFIRNLEMLRAKTGLPLTTAASHGDFANRVIGFPNTALLENPEFRVRAGIVQEAYDVKVEGLIQGRFSDKPPPDLWSPHSPSQAPMPERLLILIHPRQWNSRLVENLKLDLVRLFEGIVYSFRSLRYKSNHDE